MNKKLGKRTEHSTSKVMSLYILSKEDGRGLMSITLDCIKIGEKNVDKVCWTFRGKSNLIY